MPVATAGNFRLPVEPRSPKARQLLHKFWFDRCSPAKYVPPPPPPQLKEIGDHFLGNRCSSSLSYANDEVETISVGSGCVLRAKDAGCSLDLPLPPRPHLSRESSFQSPAEYPNKIDAGTRYLEKKKPLLSLHVSLDCPGDGPETPLPLDLIQSSVTLDDASLDSEDSGASPPGSSNPSSVCHSIGGTFGEPTEHFGRNLPQSFCSCRRNMKPSWRSYNSTFPKSGVSNISFGPSGVTDSRSGESSRTTCWCWSSKLVLYTMYLCAVFLVVFFTEAARMEMVPITVFLIVLSIALFLFILFCVCFIIFI